MKRFLLIVCTTFFIFQLRGQTTDSLGMPTFEKKVGIQKVVQLDSVSSKEIYSRAKLYFAENFKSAKDVIQLDDPVQGVILGKGNTAANMKGLAGGVLLVKFTIRIDIKDNRFRYTIENIKTGDFNISAEDWWKYPNMNKKQRQAIGASLYALAETIENSIKKPSIKKDDKW